MSLTVDPERVEDALDGDVAARDAVLDAAMPAVLGWCTRLGGPRVDPEDAAHDVLVTALRRLDSLRDAEAFGSWIYGITRRTLAVHRRRAWLRQWVPGMPELVDGGDSPLRQRELSEIARDVQDVLEKLPVAQREILVLRLVEDRPDSEVAELLGLPIGTVKSRLRLARDRFRKLASQRGLDAWVLPATGEITR